MDMETAKMIASINAELERARAKFPKQDIWVTLAALTEEVGELNEAVLQLYASGNPKGRTVLDVRKEAVQVAVMAMRVWLDTELVAPEPEEPAVERAIAYIKASIKHAHMSSADVGAMFKELRLSIAEGKEVRGSAWTIHQRTDVKTADWPAVSMMRDDLGMR